MSADTITLEEVLDVVDLLDSLIATAEDEVATVALNGAVGSLYLAAWRADGSPTGDRQSALTQLWSALYEAHCDFIQYGVWLDRDAFLDSVAHLFPEGARELIAPDSTLSALAA